jgi:ABC-type uncharacterized transport system permease subunit
MTTLSPSSYGRRSGGGGVLPLLVALVVGLLVGAAGGFWVGQHRGTASAAAASASVSCPPVTPASAVALPAAKTITVNVYNATTRAGLARSTSVLLVQRGFQIKSVANDPKNASVAGSAEVRYGPKGALAAKVVAAQVMGAALVPDQRADATVDFVLGQGFTALATPAQVAANLKPKPVAVPSGCPTAASTTKASPSASHS